MYKVYNKHHGDAPSNAVYIGRGSKWGNPFVLGRDGDRLTVIQKYIAYILSNDALIEAARRELKEKDLLCFCSPKECHGDVLMAIANDLAIPVYSAPSATLFDL